MMNLYTEDRLHGVGVGERICQVGILRKGFHIEIKEVIRMPNKRRKILKPGVYQVMPEKIEKYEKKLFRAPESFPRYKEKQKFLERPDVIPLDVWERKRKIEPGAPKVSKVSAKLYEIKRRAAHKAADIKREAKKGWRKIF